MKRFLYWLVTQGTLAGLLWLALVENSEGAGRVVVVYVWVILVVSLILMTDSFHREAAKQSDQLGKPRAGWFKGLDKLVDLSITGVLIWHGWWFTGVAYLVHLPFAYAAESKLDELRKGNAP